MFPFAVLGTIHHIVPFSIVRALSKRFHSRNKRTDVSLYRLLLSIPIYLLAYALIGFLLARWTSTSTAVAWLSLAPFAGIVALEYWPALQGSSNAGDCVDSHSSRARPSIRRSRSFDAFPGNFARLSRRPIRAIEFGSPCHDFSGDWVIQRCGGRLAR